MIGHERKEYGYDRLMEAIRFMPHQVPSLLRAEPELLKSTNYAGETVLEWFVVENDLDKVALLYECGGQITPYCIYDACRFANMDMLYLLLGNGGVPDDLSCCRRALSRHTRRVRKKLEQALYKFGFDLRET